MNPDSSALPLRKNGEIETRPLHVEEWLETLPYTDFQQTVAVLQSALAATHKLGMKPGTRLELLELYHRPYQYYLNLQIKAGAQLSSRQMETLQQQLQLMKQFAATLAMTARKALDESANRKTMWGQNKLPLSLVQHAITYLSHALIFTYLEYARPPRNVWKQLHSLYKFSADLGQHNQHVPLPEGGSATIEQTYSKIVLTQTVDPYHLPFGAIWEIYQQLGDWVEQTHIQPLQNTGSIQPDSRFVLDLASDMAPLPLAKFNTDKTSPEHYLLDASRLAALAGRHQNALENSQTNPELKLSSHSARSLLAHMTRAWGTPPKRYLPREDIQGLIQMTYGLNPTHFHINGGRDLLQQVNKPQQSVSADGLDVDGEDHLLHIESTSSNYATEQWEMVNQSAGGFALRKTSKPAQTVRVGELVGVRVTTGTEKHWCLGVIRWLMANTDQPGYQLGIQIIAQKAEPVAVRALQGSQADTQYQRAFLLKQSGDHTLVTGRGLYTKARSLELARGEKRHSLTSGRLLETAAGFEQFNIASR